MLGNYLGALRQWVALQHSHQCLFSLVDLHALTVKQDPVAFRARCYEFVALYLACGLDAEKNIIFPQSRVPAHAELMWLLSCHTYMGELNRMTQFKEKSQKHTANINVGLFAYPVLMAADILLYQTDLVPVGADQKQHLELARNLAMRVNNAYAESADVHDDNIFKIPEPFIPDAGARVMALQTPMQKMSKSDTNADNYIALLDGPDTVLRKCKRAVTDSDNAILYDPDNKPGVSNLISLLALTQDTTTDAVMADFEGKGYGHLKLAVAESVNAFLAPIQTEYAQWMADKAALDALLARNTEKAAAMADATLNRFRAALGLL